MSEWTTSESNPGYRTKTVKRGNCTIIIERPIMAPAEQAKREAQVKTNLERALRDFYIRTEATA